MPVRTILHCRTDLDWTFRGSSYCQLIWESNKSKRLNWSLAHRGEAADGFEDVIWMNESSIKLETHRRYCCRKKRKKPKNKHRDSSTTVHVVIVISLCLVAWCTCRFVFNGFITILCKAKHPVKVQVWADISLKGATGICNFDGIVNTDCYINILRETFLPFLHEVMSDRGP